MINELNAVNAVEKKIRMDCYNVVLGYIATSEQLPSHCRKQIYKVLREAVTEMFTVLCDLVGKGSEDKFYPKFNNAVGERISISKLVELRNKFSHSVDDTDTLNESDCVKLIVECCDALIPAFYSVTVLVNKKYKVIEDSYGIKATPISSILTTIKEFDEY